MGRRHALTTQVQPLTVSRLSWEPLLPLCRQAIKSHEEGVQELVWAEKIIGHLIKKEQVMPCRVEQRRGKAHLTIGVALHAGLYHQQRWLELWVAGFPCPCLLAW